MIYLPNLSNDVLLLNDLPLDAFLVVTSFLVHLTANPIT